MTIGYYLYLVFTVSYFLHVTARIPALGAIRFDLLLNIVLIGLAFLQLMGTKGRDKHLAKPETSRRLLILCAYIIVTLPFVRWPGSVVRVGLENYLKVIVFYLFSVAFITDEKRLKNFVFVFLGCQIIRMLEPLFLHVTTGYWGSGAYSMEGGLHFTSRLAGAPSDVVNPNQFAWIIISTIPFIYFLWWKLGTGMSRKIAIGLAPPAIYALALTGSRTGLLSFIVMLIAMAWLEKKRLKSMVAIAVVIVPIVIVIGGILSSDMLTRYRSLVDEKAAGRSTVVRRIDALVETLSFMQERAVFGHGLSTSRETNWNVGGVDQIAHNLYIEILQELGIVGLVIFLMYVYAIWKCLVSAKKTLEEDNEENRWLINFITAIQAWILMDLFYSMACFGLSSWEWYLFGGLAAVSYRLAHEKSLEQEAEINSADAKTVSI
jgi:putative inorganic carbon (hco3(-)) transporter